ncbi:hypothetical protein QQS21_004268 [Conoideocrella luteorostrata]|uniref:Spore coat protein SP96 n=1 Tax=Conoideocrella luteorostrata TaxID=1105319 RepID=A0AAJ0CRS4_9HYPO|nr:hypothetical protein QQS21_004268 [Conoideocrella luteorostrata]
MKVFSITALTVLSASGFAAAHMEMKDPPPLRSKFNKFTTNTDYDMTSPMAANGANFPCKGHLSVLGSAQAQTVADWTPGQPQSLTITGGANHNGGSCQASLSFDDGKTWKVIHSWIGNCPTAGESKYQFTVPQDTPAGKALFAWSWFNQVGNREMYMNCAAINIKDGGKKKRGSTQSLQSRPEMFVANVGKGCGTSEGTDLMFPNPGPDVDMNSKKTAPPTGSCPGSTPYGSSPAPAPAPAPGKPSPSASSSSAGPAKPTATTPSKVNNGQTKPSTPTKKPEPVPVPAPSRIPETPSEDNEKCTPGAFACSSDTLAWQVCAVSQSWVRIAECGSGQVCQFNKANNTPYCVAKKA